MNGFKEFFSLWKISIVVFLLIILGILFTILFSHYDNELIKLLTIKQSSVDSLVNTIWQVHTAIATLTIALMALLVGFNTNKKFGINSLEYILVIRKEFFKYQDEIMISILLIFIQYFFVAYQALAGVVLLFTFNIFLIGHMAYTSIKLSLGDSQVSNEIKSYLIDEIRNAVEIENEDKKNEDK